MARLVAERGDVVPVLGEVFRRYGFEGTSITRITEQTGLGKGSLYHFFPGGKDEMAEAVLAHIHGWFEENIFRPLDEGDPAVGIGRMFTEVAAYFQSGRRVCLVGVFALDDTRGRFAGAVNGYFSRWITALAGALQRAGFDGAAAERRAGQVVAGIQGAIVLARALDDTDRFADVIGNLQALCRVS
mgnify:FL=1